MNQNYQGKLVLLIVGLALLVYGHPVQAWEWQTLPLHSNSIADLVGEVIEVSNQGIILQVGGKEHQVSLGSHCVITLNGLPVQAAALQPIAPGEYVEARLCLEQGLAVKIEAIYCQLEVEVIQLQSGMVKLRPINNSRDLGDWVEVESEQNVEEMRVGAVYLVRLNSEGKVKKYHCLSPFKGETLYLANNLQRSVVN